MAERVTVPDMMNAREARAQAQRTLLARYPGAAVVCLCMNIAGPVKRTENIERAFAWGAAQVKAVLAPYETLFDAAIHEKTGPEAMICVRAEAKAVKKRLCALEDGEELGRLLDIDVIAPDGGKISRTDIGLPARRCLLCDKPAPVCARSRAHSVDALFERANAMIDAHFEAAFAARTAENAQRALLCEVAVTPKPGLVDRHNAGAHNDMDVFTFIHSACALRPYFENCARIGLAHRGGDATACFDALRVPGLLAEDAMRSATGGVNTHKGAIFSLGIACASLGMGYGAPLDVHETLMRCGAMTGAQMHKELEAAKAGQARTFGETIYQKAGIGGVRAEAAGGFASVREIALPRLEAGLSAGLPLNDAALCALVALMASTQDTNAVRRGGEDGAAAMRGEAQALDGEIVRALEADELQQKIGRLKEQLADWDVRMSAAGISPGGCADLLAMALLMAFCEEDEGSGGNEGNEGNEGNA